MFTLIGSALGFATSFLPKIMDYFQSKADNAHELKMLEAMAANKRDEMALDAEIRDYPTPVSGCDAQYNHLLAERRRAHEALQVLDAEIHIPTPRAP